jgi:hypothetical protein
LLFCHSWKKNLPKILKSISIFSKKTWTKRFAISALIITIIASSFTFFNHPTPVLGQTYSLTQNDWSGGTSAGTANGPNNLSGYNKYASASGVTAGAGSIALTPTQSSFTDSFDTTTYRDAAATTANWSTSGQLAKAVVPAYSSADLSAALAAAGMTSSQTPKAMLTDSANGVIYVGFNDGAFVKYDPATNVATDISTSSGLLGINSSWATYGFKSMFTDGGKIYMFSEFSFVVYDPVTGLATDIASGGSRFFSDSNYARIVLDGPHHKLYIRGDYPSKFGVYDTVTGSKTDLTVSSGYNTVMPGNGAAMVFDPADGKIYIAGQSGDFAVFDPTTGIMTGLATSSGYATIVGTSSVNTGIFCSLNNKIYFDSGYPSSFFSYDPAANTTADLTQSTNYGTLTGGNEVLFAFDPIGNKLYLGGYGALWAYSIIAGGTLQRLDTGYGLNWFSYNWIETMVMDSTSNKLYIAAGYSVFGELTINQTATTATNLTSSIKNLTYSSWVTSTLYSPADNKLYIAGTNSQLIQYDPATGTAVDVSTGSGLAAVLAGNSGITAMAYDESSGKIYLGSGRGRLFVYTPGGTVTDLTTDSGLSTFWIDGSYGAQVSAMVFDTINHRLYLSGYTSTHGLFAVYTPGSPGTVTDLTTATSSACYYTTGVNAMAYNTTDKKIYLVGNNGCFASYAPGSPGTAVSLSVSSGLSANWYADIFSVVFDPVNDKIYVGGTYAGFAVYDPKTGIATYLKDTSGLSASFGDTITKMAFDEANVKLYISGYMGELAVYTPGTPGTVTNLTTSSGLSSLVSSAGRWGEWGAWGSDAPYTMAFDSAKGKPFVVGLFASLAQINTIPSARAVSLSTDATLQKVQSVTLTKHDTVGGGSIMYLVSNDGGATYGAVTPGSLYAFSSLGSDLRFKVLLDGNATVQDVTLTYNYFPTTGTLISSKFDAVDPTNILNQVAWDEDQNLPAGTGVTVSMRTASSAAGLDSAPWVNFKNGQPGSVPNNVAESFTDTTHRDATGTTATWDGSGQLWAGSFSANDLKSLLPPSMSDIRTMTMDETNRLIYLGDQSGHFTRYNIASNTAEDLTVSSGLSAFWGTANIGAMTVLQGNVYILNNNGDFAVYDPTAGTSGTAHRLANAWGYLMAADPVHNMIYIGSGGGAMYAYDIGADTVTSIRDSSGLSAFWGNQYYDEIRAIDYDGSGRVYIGSSNGKFAYLETASSPAGIVAHNLANIPSFSFWGTASILHILHNPADGKIYFSGQGHYFGSYTPGGGMLDITTSTNMESIPFNGSNLEALSRNADGSQIFVTDSGGGMFSYNTVAGTSSYVSYIANEAGFMQVDEVSGRIYGLMYYDGFKSFATACSVCTAVSNTIDSVSQNIYSATLTKNDTPGTGTVGYQLTNDGGVHWNDVTPGSPYYFSTTGSDLRFRINFTGNATVQDVSLTYYSASPDTSDSCAKTSTTVTCAPASVPASFQDGANDEWFQYKIELSSDGINTPTVTSAVVQFVVNAPPEVRNVTAAQNADGTVTIGYEVRDPDTANGSPQNKGHITPHFEYWNGASYQTIATMAADDLSAKTVNADGTTWNAYSATWTPSADYPGHFMNGTEKIRVTANDGEGANPTGSAESGVFRLDTKKPTGAVPMSVEVESGPWSSAFSGVSSSALSISTSAASYILVGVSANGGGNEHVTAVTGPGLTFTKLAGGAIPDHTADNAEYWGAFSSSSLSNAAITAELSNPSNIGMSVISLANVSASDPIGTVIGPTSQTGDLSASFGATTDGSMLFAAAFSREYDWNSLTASSNTTLYAHTNVAQFIRSSAAVPGGSYTISSVGWSPSTTAEYAGVEIKSILGNTPYVTVDASGAVPAMRLSAADDSTFSMKISTTDPSLASTDAEPFAASKNLPGLAEGDTVYAKVTDAFSNSSNVMAAPVPMTPTSVIIQDISNVVATPNTFRMFVAWKATTGAFASYRVHRSTSEASPETWPEIATVSAQSTNYYVDSAVARGDSLYYYVTAVDPSGNISFRSSIVHGTANGTQDAGEGGGGMPVAPTISNVSFGTPLSTKATITWDTDTLSNSVVEYSTVPSTFAKTVTSGSLVNNAAGVGAHSVIVAGLTPATAYYFRVRSTDINSQSTVADNGGAGYMLTTPAGPVISGTSVQTVTNYTANVSWTTNVNATTQLVYSVHADMSNPVVTSGTSDPTMSHAVTIGNLLPGTKYYFYVRSVDTNGNETVDDNVVDGQTSYYDFTTTNDQTAPVITDVGSRVQTTTADIIWTTDKAADSQVEYGPTTTYGTSSPLDATSTVRHVVTLTGLTPGTLYDFRVKSRDVNLNAATGVNATFTTLVSSDVTPPAITAVTVTGIGLNTATVNWTTDEPATSFVEYGADITYGQSAGDVTNRVTSHAVTLTNLAPNATYHFKIHSEDAAGNAAAYSDSGVCVFTTAADTTPPAITAVGASLVSDTSAVIVWKTNEPSTSQVTYGDTTAYGSQTAVDASMTTGHSVTVSGLTKKTQYFFKVTSVDASNNSATDDNAGASYTFTTTDSPGAAVGGYRQPTADTTPPVILNLRVDSIGKNTANIDWNTDEAANGVVKYGPTIAYGILGGSIDEKISTHQVFLNDLKPGTIYHFIAVSSDASGNQASSSDRVFATLNEDGTTVPVPPPPADTTTPPPVNTNTPTPPSQTPPAAPTDPIEMAMNTLQDLVKNLLANAKDTASTQAFSDTVSELANRLIQPPSIVGSKPTVEVNGATAIVHWVTDRKTSGAVAYVKDADYSARAADPYPSVVYNHDEMAIDHFVTLLNLEPATTYHFQVRSKGAVGGEAVSADATFVTASDLPVITDISLSSIVDSAATVKWKTNVPTGSTIEYLDIAKNVSLTQGDTAMLRDHQFVLNKLSSGVSYKVTINAVDEQGNKAQSKPFFVSTSKDTTPPVISKVSSDSTLYPGKDTRVQTIVSWDTDEPSTSHVFFQEGLAKDAPQVDVPEDSTMVTAHTVVITKFRPATVYKFHVESSDPSGNKAKSNDFLILTPQQKASVLDVIIGNFEQVFGWTKKLGG